MSTRGRWGSVLLALALLVAACGDSGDGADESGDRASEPDAAGGVEAPAPGGGAVGSTGSTGAVSSTGPTSATPLSAPRDVIYTASIDVQVDSVDATIADAQRLVTAAGGLLFSRQSTSRNGRPVATLVFKVPPDVFLQTLDVLGAMGEEQSRLVKADDVSAQVVDLESRLKIAQASVDRTRELLARASSVGEIVTLERELATRETTLEQLQGQIRVLRGQIVAGTVTVNLAQRASELRSEDDDDIPSPIDGLRAGGRALLVTGRVAALVLFAVAPWLPVLLAVLWIGRRWSRRSERRRAAALASRPTGLDPSGPYLASGSSGRRTPPPPPPPAPAPAPAPPEEAEVPQDAEATASDAAAAVPSDAATANGDPAPD